MREHEPASNSSTMSQAVWDERYRDAEWVWSLTPNRFVAELLAGLPPGRALDLACGEGRNALWLAGRGWRVTAVDFSEVALNKGRMRAEMEGLEVDWTAADLTVYVPEPGAFDLVLIAYLHLLPHDRDTVLRRAADALAPGGRLFAIGHDVKNLTEGAGGPQDPNILYTPEKVTAPLTALRIERAERVTRPIEGAPKPAIDTLVVAVRD
jgi:SAM-dependent methyltransferase